MLPHSAILRGASRPRQHTGKLFALTAPEPAKVESLFLYDFPLILKGTASEFQVTGRALPKICGKTLHALARAAKALEDDDSDTACAALAEEGVSYRKVMAEAEDVVVGVVLPSGDVLTRDSDGGLLFGRHMGLGRSRFEWTPACSAWSAEDALIAITWLTHAQYPPTDLRRKAKNWANGTLLTF